MKLSVLTYPILVALSGCSGSHKLDSSSDFQVQFSSRSAIQSYEVAITITTDELRLSFNNVARGNIFNQSYTLQKPDREALYEYLRSVDFLSLKSPKADLLVDAPQTSISASYDGRSNTIEFGRVQNLPDTIAALRKKIFDVASKYNKEWQKKVGFE